MRTKALGAWIAAVMTIAGLTVIGTALFNITQVGSIEETSRGLEHDASTKGKLLNELRDAEGFTAMVHIFSYHAGQQDREGIANIKREIIAARDILAAYGIIGANDTERAALEVLSGIVELYAENLTLAERMAQDGKSSSEIEDAVTIDAEPALEAIIILDAALNQSRSESAVAVHDSVTSITLLMNSALAISSVILIVLVVGFFRFLESRAERNQAQRDLAKKTAILEATLNNVDQGISFVDADLNLVAFNQRFLELLNFPLDRFEIGDPFEYFIRYNAERGEYGPGDVDTQVKERVDLAKQFTSHHLERERPDGTIIEIHGNALPDGQGFVTTYSDITERKKAERELLEANSHLEERRLELKKLAREATDARDAAEAANRSKSDFLANMSHELRTPLNAVIGFSDMMQNELLGPVGNPQYLSYAKDIHSSGQHLLGLINDILDISKIESGVMELFEEPVDIARIVRSSLTLVKTRAEDGAVTLQNNAMGPFPALNADARKIKQIIINLLSNAVKFTPEGGTVSIAATVEDDGCFSLEVTDTGIGISSEDIERVMKPFIQADTTLARKYEGTGLGLPLTKALIEMHGGSFELRSEEGVGTEAFVRFPANRTLDKDHMDELSGVA